MLATARGARGAERGEFRGRGIGGSAAASAYRSVAEERRALRVEACGPGVKGGSCARADNRRLVVVKSCVDAFEAEARECGFE